TDAENDTLVAQLVTGPTRGTLTFGTDGGFTYVPKTNFAGTDTFTYRAYDGIAVSNTATGNLHVTKLNDIPIPTGPNLTAQSGGPQTIRRAVLLNNDIDPDGTYRATFFSEGFEGLPLQPWNTGTATNGDGTDWTNALPAGWVRDNTT